MRIFIEGNIGAGKSTFLEYLKDQFQGMKVVPEPIAEWQNFCGIDLLQGMYEQPQDYGTAFQMYAMLTSFETLTKTTNENLVIIERCMLSMKHIFIPSMRTLGFMSDVASYVFDAWLDFLIKNQRSKPDIIIYIKTSARTVQQRIENRGRRGEEEVELNRLMLLQNGYDRWIQGMIDKREAREFDWPSGRWMMTSALGGYNKTAIITLNGDLEGDYMKTEYERCVTLLKKCIEILQTPYN